MRDLETVVDALGLERFPLLGISQGGPIAITYAARHPERVSHLVVYGTCARATWAAGRRGAAPRAGRARRADQDVVGQRPARASGRCTTPGSSPTARSRRGGRSTSCSAARRRRATRTGCGRPFGALDCADAARPLDVPTLILHATDDQVWSFEEAEELHAMVPGSRLVPLPAATTSCRRASRRSAGSSTRSSGSCRPNPQHLAGRRRPAPSGGDHVPAGEHHRRRRRGDHHVHGQGGQPNQPGRSKSMAGSAR